MYECRGSSGPRPSTGTGGHGWSWLPASCIAAQQRQSISLRLHARNCHRFPRASSICSGVRAVAPPLVEFSTPLQRPSPAPSPVCEAFCLMNETTAPAEHLLQQPVCAEGSGNPGGSRDCNGQHAASRGRSRQQQQQQQQQRRQQQQPISTCVAMDLASCRTVTHGHGPVRCRQPAHVACSPLLAPALGSKHTARWQRWLEVLEGDNGLSLSTARLVSIFIDIRKRCTTAQAPQTETQSTVCSAPGAAVLARPLDSAVCLRACQSDPGRTAALLESLWSAAVRAVLRRGPTSGTAALHPWQWSHIVYACAKLRRREPQLLVAAAAATSSQAARSLLVGPALTNLVWAFAVLQWHPDSAWLEGLMLDLGHDGGLDTLCPHLLASLLWSLGALRYLPPERVMQGLLTALQPQLAALSPSEQAGAVWALARLRYLPSLGWQSTWYAASAPGLRASPAPVLVSMAASLAALRLRAPSVWFAALRSAAEAHLPALTLRQVGLLLCACAKVRLLPSPYWTRLMVERIANQQDNCEAADVAAAVWALPRLTYPHARRWARTHSVLLAGLARAAAPLLPCCSPAQLVQLVVGFAALGYDPGLQWMKSHENAAAAQHSLLSAANRQRLRQAYLAIWGT